MEVEKETEIWFAMRATYRRETDAMRLLAKENLGCFVPMQYKISMKKGKSPCLGSCYSQSDFYSRLSFRSEACQVYGCLFTVYHRYP